MYLRIYCHQKIERPALVYLTITVRAFGARHHLQTWNEILHESLLYIKTSGEIFMWNLESTIDVSTHEKTAIIKYSDEAIITIKHRGEADAVADVYTISWHSNITGHAKSNWPTDVIDLSDGHWYGGPELLRQQWPIAGCSVPLQPYISKDMVSHKDAVYGSFVERYFLK